MVIVVVILVGKVIPMFESIFDQLGSDLPLPTQVVMVVSKAFTSYWYLIFGGIFLFAIINLEEITV